MDLYLLSGGAAAGLVHPLKAQFEAKHGCKLHGTFSAVGAMKEALLQGTPCDVVILSQSLVQGLFATAAPTALRDRLPTNGLSKLWSAQPAPIPEPSHSPPGG